MEMLALLDEPCKMALLIRVELAHAEHEAKLAKFREQAAGGKLLARMQGLSE